MDTNEKLQQILQTNQEILAALAEMMAEIAEIKKSLQSNERQLLKSREVATICGFQYHHFISKVKHEASFPKPINRNGHSLWRRCDIEEYLQRK